MKDSVLAVPGSFEVHYPLGESEMPNWKMRSTHLRHSILMHAFQIFHSVTAGNSMFHALAL